MVYVDCAPLFFGEDLEEEDVAPLDKLEHTSKVLSTVPASSTLQVRIYEIS
jgi:hypothetical protein